MATRAGVLAVVRASGQQFSNADDAVVYAVHAALLASGFALIGVGDAAKLDNIAADAPELASDAGWNSSSGGGNGGDGTYALLYRFEAESQQPAPALLLFKALALGGRLVLTFARGRAGGSGDAGAGGSGGNEGHEPAVAELDATEHYDGGASSLPPAQRYKGMDALLARVAAALSGLGFGGDAAGGGGKASAAAGAGAAAGTRAGQAAGEAPSRGASGSGRNDDGDGDPLRIGPPRRGGGGGYYGGGGGGRVPRPGEDDIMPLGGDPFGGGGGGIFGGGGGGGLGPLGPTRGGGGGMHVGPGDPFFQGRMRHPPVPGALPGGLGGARWDPISPEGLPGWAPDDFARPPPPMMPPGGGGGGPGRGPPRPPVDPDLEQPGPGRATDWDSMYG